MKALIISLLVFFQLSAIAQSNGQVESSDDSLAAFIAAIEANPKSIEAHEAYIKASGFTKWNAPENPEFVQQYLDWMHQFPHNAVIPYALGHAYAGKESPKAKPYLLKAIELDPKLDEAYFDLWIDAERWGKFEQGAKYIRKAAQLEPENADYAFYAANSYEGNDLKLYAEKSLEVVQRFPKSERGAQALYWLAYRQTVPQERVKYYKMLKEKYPPADFRWSSSGMSGYFFLLLKEQPEKAKDLALEMIGQLDDKQEKNWINFLETAYNFMRADQLIRNGIFKDALTILDSTKLLRWSDAHNQLLTLKVKALNGMDKASEAYDMLVAKYAQTPEAVIEEVLIETGKSLGKGKRAIMADVWAMRDKKAELATDFSLRNYYTGKNMSLEDFRGEVVLLTYWFPGCGPCRGEFPHFQDVVNKFQGEEFAYVGINIVEDQNEYVLPFMKHSGYTFIPLEDVEGREKGNLDNRNAAPVNFLIDQQGRIIYQKIRTNEHNEDLLEAMISSLLDRSK